MTTIYSSRTTLSRLINVDSFSCVEIVDMHQSKKTTSKRKSRVLQEDSVGSIEKEDMQFIPGVAPIVCSYNKHIRPVLDVVENLRNLNITEEGIQLPAIVVVGDQSSGKSSVLESLAGISLPRGNGICTRVPLVMRLQNYPMSKPELTLEFNGKLVSTDELNASKAIKMATDELAGPGKGISNTPLTLNVKKNDVPDLTMVDLPGITRVPVYGQPENIYDQIKDIIMEYIRPEESIILNVISASVDFSTCESIRMSQTVDKMGERTLAVVTKCDKAPEGLLQKIRADEVSVGLGYVCVRNQIGDESSEEALLEEARLFESHYLLSEIDKSIVGIPILAKKLMQIQATSIAKSLPMMLKKINQRLNSHLSAVNGMPKKMTSLGDAMTVMMRTIVLSKESLRKILLKGEFDEYLEEKHMHCTVRLFEMLDGWSKKLQEAEGDPAINFLKEEIDILLESNCIGLPNFLPRSAFRTCLQGKLKRIASMPINLVEQVWDYIGNVVISVLTHHSKDYHQFKISAQQASGNLIDKMKERSFERVMELVEMEKLTDYTANPDYMSEYSRFMAVQDAFLKDIFTGAKRIVRLPAIGEIDAVFLRQYPHMLVAQAYDLKMRMVAYWKIVTIRLIDSIALHLQYSIDTLVNKELETEMVRELMSSHGSGLESLLEECPSLTVKREMLDRSIKRLRVSKEVVGNIIARIPGSGECDSHVSYCRR